MLWLVRRWCENLVSFPSHGFLESSKLTFSLSFRIVLEFVDGGDLLDYTMKKRGVREYPSLGQCSLSETDNIPIVSRTRNSRDCSHGLSSGILPSLSRDHSSRSQARKLAVDKESQTCLQSHGFRIGKDGHWSNYAQDYVWYVYIASIHAPTALLTHSPLIRQEHRLI